MEQNKILIIGAYGQLGTALKKQYPEAIAVDSDQLDITNPISLSEFDWTKVSIILNAAAYTNVDGAESEEGRRIAWAVNATAVRNLSEIATKHRITLVHISTDYVFDGNKSTHTEDEQLSPLSVYVSSKAAGDLAVQLTPKHYILRTSWVIGEGKNFVRTMMDLANRDISPTVVHDQVGRLTFTSELVRAIDHLISKKCEFGIYNLSNSGKSVSWADITRNIYSILGRNDLTVTNTTTEEYYAGKSGMALRPLQSTLELSKIQATGFTSTSWEDDLNQYMKEQAS